MRKIILLSLLLSVIFSFGQDTIYVTSRTDSRLLSYQDSLNAYNTGKSVCDNLLLIFRKLTHSNDYDTYFIDGWNLNIKEGDRVDTLLGESYFHFSNELPSNLNQFQANSESGRNITTQFHRLDSLKVRPYGQVVGAEMPTLYIYKKPERVVVYQKLDRCWEKKRVYSTLDIQTHFIVNQQDKTIIPYNILRYYQEKEGPDKLTKIEWIDPVDKNKIIKYFSY